jgi:hypothetical protein
MLRCLAVLVLATAVLLAVTEYSSAGGCPRGGNCGCGGVVEVAPPCAPTESYLVNQGPVLSGPGHYLAQLEAAPPCCDIYRYPYVGFVYSGYPYGRFGPASGYPRGFYNPYAGYPYADGYPPYYDYRAQWYARRHVGRPAPVHSRTSHPPMTR